jgi:hypothetical protein
VRKSETMSLPAGDARRTALAEAGFGNLLELPIDSCIEALAEGDMADAVALGACLVRPAEVAPAIIALMERAIGGEALSDGEVTILFRGLHILGAARHPDACATLLRMLALPEAQLEYLLGDAITETLPRIVAGAFDGDAEALLDAVADRGRDEYVRDALLGAATWLAWQGRIELGRLKGLLELFDEAPLAEDGECVWLAWTNAIALLGLSQLAPRVEQSLDRRMPENVMTLADFREDLAAALRDDAQRFERAHLGYIEDAYATLEQFAWVDDDSIEDDWDENETEAGGWTPQAPVLNPFRRVGRNDPCPCGSGRKAKKCCLSGAA